ncbi:MAG: DUF4351 domain-containing protein [Pseudomonadota bacterium]
MLDIFNVELKQTRFYQEVFAEGLEEGIQKGILEGVQKGRQKGRQEGEGLLLMRQLERKFGPLGKEARSRINGADAETPLVWDEQVLTAPSLEVVFGEPGGPGQGFRNF